MKRIVRVRLFPLFVAILVVIPMLSVVIFSEKSLDKKTPVKEEKDTYPVINTSHKIIYPYTDNSVKVGKTYYDYKADEASQENSITEHNNTYIQNTGIDYISDKIFDVVSVLEGEVINVKEDNLLGKVVEIKHDNDLITSYQSLSEVSVKKGDSVSQGQVIGKSGNNELDSKMGNHLHFEIIKNANSVNPDNYLNKEINN